MGYQYGSPDAINTWYGTGCDGINSDYVDGVSLTYGSPRQHVWIFMAGTFESKQQSMPIFPVLKVLHKLFSLLLVKTTSVSLVIQILIGNLNSILLILSGTRRDVQQLNSHVVKFLVSHGSTRSFGFLLLTLLMR